MRNIIITDLIIVNLHRLIFRTFRLTFGTINAKIKFPFTPVLAGGWDLHRYIPTIYI